MLLGVQTFFLCAKMQKIPKNSKDGHFQIPHPQISLKQFSNICKNVVYFFLLCKDFHKTIEFFVTFETTTHCNFKF